MCTFGRTYLARIGHAHNLILTEFNKGSCRNDKDETAERFKFQQPLFVTSLLTEFFKYVTLRQAESVSL